MLIPINITETKEYSLDSDISETKTIWLLGYFNSFESSKLQNRIGSIQKKLKNEDEIDITDIVFDTVRLGLKGVKNFPIEFVKEKKNVLNTEKEVVSDNFLSQCKIEWLTQLYSELLRMNFLSESESKN